MLERLHIIALWGVVGRARQGFVVEVYFSRFPSPSWACVCAAGSQLPSAGESAVQLALQRECFPRSFALSRMSYPFPPRRLAPLSLRTADFLFLFSFPPRKPLGVRHTMLQVYIA